MKAKRFGRLRADWEQQIYFNLSGANKSHLLSLYHQLVLHVCFFELSRFSYEDENDLVGEYAYSSYSTLAPLRIRKLLEPQRDRDEMRVISLRSVVDDIQEKLSTITYEDYSRVGKFFLNGDLDFTEENIEEWFREIKNPVWVDSLIARIDTQKSGRWYSIKYYADKYVAHNPENTKYKDKALPSIVDIRECLHDMHYVFSEISNKILFVRFSAASCIETNKIMDSSIKRIIPDSDLDQAKEHLKDFLDYIINGENR